MTGKIIFVRRKGQEEFVDEFHGEYMGSLELENGKIAGFLCKDGSLKGVTKLNCSNRN